MKLTQSFLHASSGWVGGIASLVLLLTCLAAGCHTLLDGDPTAPDRPLADQANRPGQPSDSESAFEVDGITFSRIPAGRFLMGASGQQVPLQYSRCEFPAHAVVLPEDFLMSRKEVTVAQFRRFVTNSGYRTESEQSASGCNSLNLATGAVQCLPDTHWASPGFPQADDHPVVCVSWNDANAFCAWLSARHGQQFRLPTEAEWEYACRAGTRTLFNTGDSWGSLNGSANLGDLALTHSCPLAGGTADWDDGFAFTAPTGSFLPNAFGLHDLHGNVGEWCLDWFDPEYYGTSPETSPTGPLLPRQWHSVRGGSWYNSPLSCRSSGRHDGVETAASTTNGFRIVMELPQNSR